MDSTSRRQPCERQPLLTGGPEEGQSFGRKWKVFCAVYFTVVLIVGVALEAATSDQNCLVTFWFPHLGQVPGRFYSIVCITIALVLVVLDVATSRCLKSRKRLERDEDIVDPEVGSNIATTLSLRVATIFIITLLGLGALVYVIVQCGAGFELAKCWSPLLCIPTCPKWAMTIALLYFCIKCIFVFTQVVYFWMLTISNTALFSKSRLNTFMVHHVAATTLYLCVRCSVEVQTYLKLFPATSTISPTPTFSPAIATPATSTTSNISNISNILITVDSNCENGIHSILDQTHDIKCDYYWVDVYSSSHPYYNGVVQLFPLVVVLGLLFVAHYFDLWNTYKQNRNISVEQTNQPVSTSSFQQFLSLSINHLRERTLLPSTFVQAILFAGYLSVTVFVYADDSLPNESNSGLLKMVQLYCFAMALLMTLLVGAGLIIIHDRVVVERALGPFHVLLLMGLLGVLCDIFYSVLGMSFRGIMEQILWIVQSVLQAVLITLALQREGRHSRSCCGVSPLAHVLDTLIVLNVGVAIFDVCANLFYTKVYLQKTRQLYFCTATSWIYAVTAPFVVLFRILSCLMLMVVRSKHSRYFSAINMRRAMGVLRVMQN
jgi:ribosomal protein L31